MKALLTMWFVLAAVVFTGSAAAQQPDTVSVRKEAMKKLAVMAGKWQGTGWTQLPSGRETATGTEHVQIKLDGLAMLIEGRFVDRNGKVAHESLGVLTYDEAAKAYRLSAKLASGREGLYEVRIVGDAFQWGFDVPGGAVRFTIRFENDTWHEIGEFSADGKTWVKTLEMKLAKVK